MYLQIMKSIELGCFHIHTFLTNTLPFMALGILTVVQLAILLKKSDERLKLFILYIVFYGFTLNVETVLFIFLHAYDYYPKIYPSNQFMDSLFGNLFSQASVAASGLMVAFFDFKIIRQLVVVAVYFVIEELFQAIGVYEHHWFRTWMTSSGMLVLFWILKKMFHKYYGTYGSLVQAIFSQLGFFALFTVTLNWFCFVVTGIFTYNSQLLPDPGVSWGTMGVGLTMLLFMVCYFAYHAKRWYLKLIWLIIGFAAQYAAWRLSLFLLKPGWFVPYTLSILAAGYLIVAFLGLYIRRSTLSTPPDGSAV